MGDDEKARLANLENIIFDQSQKIEMLLKDRSGKPGNKSIAQAVSPGFSFDDLIKLQTFFSSSNTELAQVVSNAVLTAHASGAKQAVDIATLKSELKDDLIDGLEELGLYDLADEDKDNGNGHDEDIDKWIQVISIAEKKGWLQKFGLGNPPAKPVPTQPSGISVTGPCSAQGATWVPAQPVNIPTETPSQNFTGPDREPYTPPEPATPATIENEEELEE